MGNTAHTRSKTQRVCPCLISQWLFGYQYLIKLGQGYTFFSGWGSAGIVLYRFYSCQDSMSEKVLLEEYSLAIGPWSSAGCHSAPLWCFTTE